MTWDNNKYVKLLLERREGKRDKYLIALRTTADFYGWTQEWEEWQPKSWTGTDGRQYCRDPGRRGEMFCEAGTQLRICREPSQGGWPSSKTNAFKVSHNCGFGEIAEIAHFTTVEWFWMTGPTGGRIKRESWEEIYQAHITPGGGLMSRTRHAGVAQSGHHARVRNEARESRERAR